MGSGVGSGGILLTNDEFQSFSHKQPPSSLILLDSQHNHHACPSSLSSNSNPITWAFSGLFILLFFKPVRPG